MIRQPHDLSPAERADHHAKWGCVNDFPPGWREMPEKEAAQSAFFGESTQLVEFRQMFRAGSTEPVQEARLFFLPDDTGFALVSDFWGGKVRFFRFGCEHEFQHQPDGSGVCRHCGFVQLRRDSSD